MRGYLHSFPVIFAIAVMLVSPSYGQATLIKEWKGTESLDRGILGVATTTYHEFLYVLGGNDGSSGVDSIYHTKVNPDGSLVPWKKTTSLPYHSDLGASTVHESYIYYLGGKTKDGYVNGVFYAAIRDDGSISFWKGTASLPVALGEHSIVVWDKWIYVIGGTTKEGVTNAVSISEIQPDGSLSGWKKISDLPYKLTAASAVVYESKIGPRIYVIGGYDGSGYHNTVISAEIRSDGSLGGWQKTSSLPRNVCCGAAAVIEDYIFHSGGFDGAKPEGIRQVYAAKIYDDGGFGTWEEEAPLPETRVRHGMEAYGGRAYVIAGLDGDKRLRSVVYSSPTVGPSPATTTTTTTAAPTVTVTSTSTLTTTSTIATTTTITSREIREITVTSTTATTIRVTDTVEKPMTVTATYTMVSPTTMTQTITSPTTLVRTETRPVITTLTSTLTETSPITVMRTTTEVSPTTLTRTETLKEKVQEGLIFRSDLALGIAFAMVLVSIGVSLAIARLGKR